MSIHGQTLNDAEKRAWLRLARTQNVGPATFAALIARFGSAAAALAEVPRLAKRGGGGADLRTPSDADAKHELDTLARLGGHLIASTEPDFPRTLAALDPPPPVISVIGNRELLKREMIAVVGARNASALGRKFASQLAKELGEAGVVVVSGMARGIDTAAHEGSLSSGTCAVVAGGVDIVYPPENADLYEHMKKQGLIVSEMPVGLTPQARHFPRRNRIISGLSHGVVIVEAAEGSGSLITANFALEQGREVFAVPGSPLDPRAKGTNRLIREGAILIENAEDVLSSLHDAREHAVREPGAGAPVPGHSAAIEAEADRVRREIEELLGPSPVEIDELARQCKVPVQIVLTLILELELAGRIERHRGNRVNLL